MKTLLYIIIKKIIIRRNAILFLKKNSVIEKGIYLFSFKNKTILYNKAYDNFTLEYKDKGLTTKLVNFFPIVVKKSITPSFSGQAIMISEAFTIKVLDIKKKTIITFLDTYKAQKIYNDVLYFSNYLPSTIVSLSNNSFLVENYIDSINIRKSDLCTKEIIIRKICEDQLRLILSTKISSYNNYIDCYSDIRDFISNKLQHIIEKYFFPIISQILVLPAYKLHCDIHFGNILLSEESHQLYYIDFEYSRDEIPFYDICNLAFVEFMDNDDTCILDMFFDKQSFLYGSLMSLLIKLNIDNSLHVEAYIYRYLINRIVFDVTRAIGLYRGKELSSSISGMENNYIRFFEYIQRRANNDEL